MPGVVRAGQITIWAMTGLTVLVSLLVGIAAGPRAAGRTFGRNLMGLVLFVLAFRYGTAGTGVRTTSIVLAGIRILLALGGTARGVLGGAFALLGAIAVVILLSQGSAGRWSGRPRVPGGRGLRRRVPKAERQPPLRPDPARRAGRRLADVDGEVET